MPTFVGIGAEVGLIVLPNLLLPLLLLRYAWPQKIERLSLALGWTRNGWRPILVGIAAFGIHRLLSTLLSNLLGPGISYNKPGQGGPIPGWLGLLVLLGYVLFALLTAAGEETMFRGLIQTQVSHRYGVWAGILLTMLLFGLRHLPADIFYAQLSNATAGMWLSREVDLYLGAGLFGLARHFGRSTYSSAMMHFLILVTFAVA